MMGSLLAGAAEAPGEYFYENGIRLKKYQGISSGTSCRPSALVDGVSGAVVDKGSIHQIIPYLCQSLRHGFQDLGEKSIPDIHEQCFRGNVRFEVRSICAQKEGGVHDLFNYSKRLYA